MKRLAQRLTVCAIKNGIVSEESYAVYQYGFQIGLEMLLCFGVCLSIAIYLHMIKEFVVFTGIFMLLRTYAGGVHLNSIGACLMCSVIVQTLTLIIDSKHKFSVVQSWTLILVSVILIFISAPAENMNRLLDNEEKKHCKEVTMKIIAGILIFSGFCTLIGEDDIVSLVTLTVLVVLISQYVGILRNKVEKSKRKFSQ